RDFLGASKHFNALSQEKTGDFWVNGHLFGAQLCHTAETIGHPVCLVGSGSNPGMAHGFKPPAKPVIEPKKGPGARMMATDPRRTEVAEVADLHLQLRPGTDAFLLGAILATILRRGGEAADFLAAYTVGFDEVRATLSTIPVETWVAHAEVALADVERAVDM